MLFLKSTSTPVYPGVFAVDVAAKPPGKTFMIYAAVDAANLPASFIQAVEGMGFRQLHARPYVHGDGTKVLDLHFEKNGTGIFNAWTDAESNSNLEAIAAVMSEFNIKVKPRVMSLAEAFP
jgi:hypothetical protein